MCGYTSSDPEARTDPCGRPVAHPPGSVTIFRLATLLLARARTLRGTFTPCDADTRSPRKTRRVHSRKRQTPVRAPSPMTAVQAVQEMAGAVIYDCRPSVLPVSIKLKDFRRPSVVRPATSPSLAAPLSEEAPVSMGSIPERTAAPVFAVVASDDSGTGLEDVLLHVSPLLTMVSPLPDSDTAFPVSSSRYPEPPVPALADPAPASQLSSVPLRVVNALPSHHLFPSYTMSLAHSTYLIPRQPHPSRRMCPMPRSVFRPGVRRPWAGSWAGDGDLLLDCSSDFLPMLPLPLLPLPDSFCRLRLRRLICLGRVPSARVRVSQCRGLPPRLG